MGSLTPATDPHQVAGGRVPGGNPPAMPHGWQIRSPLVTALFVLLVFATMGISGAAARPPGPAYPPGPLPIATGDRATVCYFYGYALLEAIRMRLPAMSPYLIVTQDGSRNLALVSRGDAALGLARADSIRSLTSAERASLATVARLYDDYLHLVVPWTTGFRTLSDLRGHRLTLGVADAGTRRVALQLLRAAGIPTAHVTLTSRGIEAAAEDLRTGKLDGFFFFGGVPTGHLQQLNLMRPIRLIDLADEVREVRSTFNSPLSIPATAYGGEPVTTLGVPTYLVVPRNMDPDLAYALTATLFEERHTMAGIHPVVSRLDRRAAINTYPLRLHEGAARYYRDTHV